MLNWTPSKQENINNRKYLNSTAYGLAIVLNTWRITV